MVSDDDAKPFVTNHLAHNPFESDRMQATLMAAHSEQSKESRDRSRTSVRDDPVTTGMNMEDAISATCQELVKRGFWLKQKQLEAISSFCSGRDVFVSLPTGYGKSIIYATLPLVFDNIRGSCLWLTKLNMLFKFYRKVWKHCCVHKPSFS